MTDNEIIKALECCGKNPPVCHECKYKGKCNRIDCYDYLKRDVLDLINRQKANAEGLTNAVKYLTEQVSSAKAEAKKEFADMLIQKIVNTPTKFESSYYMYRQGITYRQDEIIDIIKEMSGDEA